MANRTVTIRDVADKAGVSTSTVSRVLSGAETAIPISGDTRDRVQQAARELGYRPHPSARALSGKGTNLLGVIVREIGDPWFAQLMETISEPARDRGYDLVLGNAKRDPEEALALRNMMLDLRYCDGLLLCGDLQESLEDRSFVSEMSRDHCVVSVSRGSKELVENIPAVGVDNHFGTFLALEHLHKLGHRKIGCVNTGRVGDLWERVLAYREFVSEKCGELRPEYEEWAENSYEGGYRATQQLLSLPTPPTAIFATDDTVAMGVMAAAMDMGLEVPVDVSVVGFDDLELSAYLRPALTTVRQPMDEIGKTAVELLLEMVEQECALDATPQILLKPQLVVRDSCAPPKSGA